MSKTKKNKNKGLATVDVVISVFFVFIIIFIFGAMAISNAVKQDELSIIQGDTLAVKNTFSLFNRSLDATWSLSTVQALFESTEHGFEPSSIFAETPKDAYWYRFHPSEKEKILLPQGESIPGIPDRCNQPLGQEGGNPGICLPNSVNIQNFMNITMQRIWFDLSDETPYNISRKPVKIAILGKNSTDLDVRVLKFWPASDRFVYEIATRVSVEGFRSKLDAYAVSTGFIKTDLSRMIKIGWLAVSLATKLRWEAKNTNNYQYSVDTRGFYELSSSLDRYFDDGERELSLEIQNIPRSEFFIDIDPKIDFKVPASSSTGHGLSQGGGLLLHYDANVKIQEGKVQLNIGPQTVISESCKENPAIGDYIDDYEKQESFISASSNGLKFYTVSPNSITASIITEESSWNINFVDGDQLGLMNIHKDTADKICGFSQEQLKDPEDNIKCGTRILENYIETARNHVRQLGGNINDNDNLMKIALALYSSKNNAQQLLNTIKATGKWKYEEISTSLPANTQTYVTGVMANSIIWKSCVTGAGSMPADYARVFTKAAQKYGISPNLLASVFKCGEHTSTGIENRPKENLDINNWPNINGPWASSSAGASGPFQFIPGTWAAYQDDCNGDGIRDVQDIEDAACGAAKYLRNLVNGLECTLNSAQTKEWSAAACYNGGENGAINARPTLGSAETTYTYAERVKGCFEYLGGSAEININPVLQLTQECRQEEDIGKYICKQNDPRRAQYSLFACKFQSGGFVSEKEDANKLKLLGITDYPCRKSDCSDCLLQIGENTINSIGSYKRYLERKASTVVSLEESYCEDRKDILSSTETPRGNKHLAYNLFVPRGARIFSAYEGEVVYSSVTAPSFFDSCGGIVIVKSGSLLIAYSNIAPSSTIGQIPPSNKQLVTKDNVLGTLANKCDHVEIRVFRSSFTVPKQENSKNLCGTETNCWKDYGPEGKVVSVESYIPQNPGDTRVIPYWCSAIDWSTDSTYHKTLIPTIGKNVRYDEDNNRFYRDNFAIEFSMEDWFTVLNCQNTNQRFWWSTPNDMMCNGGKLYTCDRDIPGIGSQKISEGNYVSSYRCVAGETQTEKKTRFCNTAGTPESAEGGENVLCCNAWSDSPKSQWLGPNDFVGYCQNDDYCSEEEKANYGAEYCRLSRDCCISQPECASVRSSTGCPLG